MHLDQERWCKMCADYRLFTSKDEGSNTEIYLSGSSEDGETVNHNLIDAICLIVMMMMHKSLNTDVPSTVR